MRKYIKTRLLNYCDSLLKATDLLKKLIDSARSQDMRTLLTDMQATAIEIGESIEQSEGEGTEAVSGLEALCESFFQIAEENLGSAKKHSKSLNASITAIKHSIRELPEQYEVLFLPYKASMWDSLASVYAAAAADPDCTAYVIPIPYYDKNPDDSLGTDHYEAGEFPADVPITHFNDYDYEAAHPDYIFIHNPYDNNNIVTSVHPFFYSTNLKKFTDCLVYIPYFVHQNDYVKDDYVLLPGVIWSDIVVLQSEEVKKQYIRYYMEGLRNTELKANPDKFKAWGSPKFDVQDTGKEKLPAEWQKLIYDQSGQRKKVVFFNTHVSGLMESRCEEFLEKLSRVFETFKAQEDVVLLWRPHPLSMATIHAMNPEAERKYLALIEKYQKEGFGIYDDSPDLHRAIDVADAYYGSKSSVAELFRNAHKPIMIMNLKV